MSHQAPTQLLLFEPNIPKSTRRPSPALFAGIRRRTARLELCVLGSGSSGNSTVIRWGESVVLVDAGFGPRTTARRLEGMGVTLDDINAICLTHLDRDHFNPNWISTLVRKRVRIYVHSRHVHSLYRIDGAGTLHRAGLLHLVGKGSFEPVAGLGAVPFTLPHDRKGTTGFVFESEAGRIGYATDLGQVPDELIQRFAGVDFLAIESNYDPQMQHDSARPQMLKQRIMGGWGHLSNQQAFEAVGRILDHSPNGGPSRVVLLHRSRQCNCPALVRRLFMQDARLAARLWLAEQGQPTGWLTVGECRKGGGR